MKPSANPYMTPYRKTTVRMKLNAKYAFCIGINTSKQLWLLFDWLQNAWKGIRMTTGDYAKQSQKFSLQSTDDYSRFSFTFTLSSSSSSLSVQILKKSRKTISYIYKIVYDFYDFNELDGTTTRKSISKINLNH
uniref:Uncharacterized protein n=1 Tax=Glossina austeni TaxID=7395 RepID=A0A1A9VW72_GLOAU